MALKSAIPNKLVVLILAMLIGGIVAAVFGFIIGLPSLRLKGDYLAIVTLAFGEIVRNIFKNQKIFGGAMGLQTGAVQYDSRNRPTLYIVTLVVALIMLVLIQNFIRSKHGRAVTAIRDNEIAAKAMGINVTFYKLFVFILAAFFAGIAGVIYSHYTATVLYSFFSYNYSIEILVMVVLGGMGSITGSIIAAVLVPIINYLLQNYVPAELAALRYLVYALVLIFIVVFSNARHFSRYVTNSVFPHCLNASLSPKSMTPANSRMTKLHGIAFRPRFRWTPSLPQTSTPTGRIPAIPISAIPKEVTANE